MLYKQKIHNSCRTHEAVKALSKNEVPHTPTVTPLGLFLSYQLFIQIFTLMLLLHLALESLGNCPPGPWAYHTSHSWTTGHSFLSRDRRIDSFCWERGWQVDREGRRGGGITLLCTDCMPDNGPGLFHTFSFTLIALSLEGNGRYRQKKKFPDYVWASEVSQQFPDCSPVLLHTGPNFDCVQNSPTVSGGPGQTPKYSQIKAAWLHRENLAMMGSKSLFSPSVVCSQGRLQTANAEVLPRFCTHKNYGSSPGAWNAKP